MGRKMRLKMPYKGLVYRPVFERIRDFEEVIIHFDEERAICEASRCLQCPGLSACMKACPVHNNIYRFLSESLLSKTEVTIN